MTYVPQFISNLNNAIIKKDDELSKLMDRINMVMDKVDEGKTLTKSGEIKFHNTIVKFYKISKKKQKRNYLPYDLVKRAFDYAVDKEYDCFFTTRPPKLEFEDDTAMSTFQFGSLTFDVYGTKFKCDVSWEDDKVTKWAWQRRCKHKEKWTKNSVMCDVGMEEELIHLNKSMINDKSDKHEIGEKK